MSIVSFEKNEVTVDYDQRGKYNLHEIKRVCKLCPASKGYATI